MKTEKPKPLVHLADHPLIQYSLDTAKALKPERIVLVTGYKKDEVKKYVISNNPGDFVFCEQKERLGTGHAVKQAAPYLPDAGKTLVLYADVPLVSVKALKKLIASANRKKLLHSPCFNLFVDVILTVGSEVCAVKIAIASLPNLDSRSKLSDGIFSPFTMSQFI